MDLKYLNHDLYQAFHLSNDHYICTKCNITLYRSDTCPIIYSVEFPEGTTKFGRYRDDLIDLTCDEVIIKKLSE